MGNYTKGTGRAMTAASIEDAFSRLEKYDALMRTGNPEDVVEATRIAEAGKFETLLPADAEFADASALGWRPGYWPPSMTHADGRTLRRTGPMWVLGRVAGMIYKGTTGRVLAVVND